MNYMMTQILDCLDEHDAGMLKAAGADRMLITVDAFGKKGPFNPAKCLIRCQVMEFLLRCALEKFYVAGLVETELEAVKKFNDEFLAPNIKNFGQEEWRKKNTFNVETDNFMKAHTKIWEHFYSKYCGKHKKPGQKDYMMVDEFD